MQKKQTPAVLAREKFLRAKEAEPFKIDNYCNERFAYCISYPVFILFPLPETANGDGRIFLNEQKEEVLRVYGIFNRFKQYGRAAIAMQFQTDIKEIEITDKVTILNKELTDDYYMITGKAGLKHFVQKVITTKNGFAYAIFQYDISSNTELEKISRNILSSFK